MNIFNEKLRKVDDARQQAREDNTKLIESVLSIGNAQRNHSLLQKQLSEAELEIKKMNSANREIKTSLMQALIERDELRSKRTALKSLNERLYNQNENLHHETDDLLSGDEVNTLCEDFAFDEQMLVIKDIQDTRDKLIKCGFPLSFFA